MNWKRLALCAMLGITMLGTAACGTKSGEQPQGNTVKAETVTMPNFSNAPIADEYLSLIHILDFTVIIACKL